jgi:tetratricopeptide (TPR) repeat protein
MTLTNIKILLTFFSLLCSAFVFAQDSKAATMALLKEGIALHDAKKFDEAVNKYNQALKLEPENVSIQFEKGYSLSAAGKTDEAVNILEKVAASNKEPSAYDVLGSIFDDKGEYGKAQKYYLAGITAFPTYQRLHFNLSICYLRQNKYVQSEQAAIDAIKLDPRHASSQRIYALATYGQGKSLNSLLAWCSFLLLEPQTERSVEGCNYLKHILYKGIKGNNITLTADKANQTEQLSISIGVNSALLLAKTSKTNGETVTSLDSLIAPLSFVLKMGGQKKDDATQAFFYKYFGRYFAALATTDYMPAFSRYITLSAFRDENMAWLKSHEEDVKGLSTWVNTTKRETE